MKKSILLVVFTSILCLQSYAQRLKNLSANYIGEKMWNTVKMVPYNGSVSLEINDSLAYLKYNRTERVDTFFFDRPCNGGYQYTRQLFRGFWQFLLISKDTLKLQVGEPKEVNYFYKLESIITVCPKCHGSAFVQCPRCFGTGRVTPNPKGSPDEAVGMCPTCGGAVGSRFRCWHCKGKGKIEVTK